MFARPSADATAAQNMTKETMMNIYGVNVGVVVESDAIGVSPSLALPFAWESVRNVEFVQIVFLTGLEAMSRRLMCADVFRTGSAREMEY